MSLMTWARVVKGGTPTANRVTDEQVAALSAAGLSDDAIFEATVSAALGASLMRFERARAAMEEANAAT